MAESGPKTGPQILLKKTLPYLTVAVAPMCWAGNIVLARGVIHIIPPIAFSFWRWMIAFCILLPFTFHLAKRDWTIARRHWKLMALLGITGISCFNTLLYKAVHTITAINGALIQTTLPAFIIVISLILFNERVGWFQIAGVLSCIFGAALVVLRGDLETLTNLSFMQGDVLMIIAVTIYALYTALIPKRPSAMHPLSFVTYTFGIGVLGLLPLYIWEYSRIGPFEVNLRVILSVLYVSVFPSIVAYICWNRGAQTIGPGRTGLFINFIPVFASILAVIFLGESVKLYHFIGMGLILTGFILFNQRIRRPSKPK